MPLILEEHEVDLIKRGLRVLMFQPAGSLKRRARRLIELLDKNPDCVHWLIMTEEERQEMRPINQVRRAMDASKGL